MHLTNAYMEQTREKNSSNKIRVIELVSERVKAIGVSPTMKVAAKAKEMKAEGINVIDLSVGEPDFPTPSNIKVAAKKAIDDNKTGYTINSGTVEFRKAISEKLKKDNGLDYSIKEIIVSNGAKQSVYNSVLTVVNPGDEVIIPAPYWVSYPEMVSLAGGKCVNIDTDDTSGFKITPDQLRKAITPKTKALILCNPSNPTGSAYTKAELEAIAEIVLANDFYVIADEIYEKLIYGDYKFVSFPSLNPELKKKTILINGMSKAFSMTGWRVGYTAATEDIVGGINKIQSHSTSNASSISQAASVEALVGPPDAVEAMRVEFEKRRDFLHEQLTSIKGFTCYKPEGAFYLFPNVSAFFGKSDGSTTIKDSMDFSMYLLNESNIAVVPGSAFGAEGYIRMSYASSMSNLKEAVERLRAAVAKLG